MCFTPTHQKRLNYILKTYCYTCRKAFSLYISFFKVLSICLSVNTNPDVLASIFISTLYMIPKATVSENLDSILKFSQNTVLFLMGLHGTVVVLCTINTKMCTFNSAIGRERSSKHFIPYACAGLVTLLHQRPRTKLGYANSSSFGSCQPRKTRKRHASLFTCSYFFLKIIHFLN